MTAQKTKTKLVINTKGAGWQLILLKEWRKKVREATAEAGEGGGGHKNIRSKMIDSEARQWHGRKLGRQKLPRWQTPHVGDTNRKPISLSSNDTDVSLTYLACEWISLALPSSSLPTIRVLEKSGSHPQSRACTARWRAREALREVLCSTYLPCALQPYCHTML